MKNDLYVEDWSTTVNEFFVEAMPQMNAPDGSTVGCVSSGSTMSCPAGCVYTYTTASSAS